MSARSRHLVFVVLLGAYAVLAAAYGVDKSRLGFWVLCGLCGGVACVSYAMGFAAGKGNHDANS